MPASPRTQEHAALPPEHRPRRAAGTPATAPVELPIPGWDAPSLHTGQVPVPGRPPRTAPVRLPHRPIPRRVLVLAAVALAVVLVVAGALIATRLAGAASPADGGSGAPTFTYRPADPAG